MFFIVELMSEWFINFIHSLIQRTKTFSQLHSLHIHADIYIYVRPMLLLFGSIHPAFIPYRLPTPSILSWSSCTMSMRFWWWYFSSFVLLYCLMYFVLIFQTFFFSTPQFQSQRPTAPAINSQHFSIISIFIPAWYTPTFVLHFVLILLHLSPHPLHRCKW